MAKRHQNRTGDLESLFLRLEELVLANSGEDEFEEVYKLVVAKLWDEKSGVAARFKVWDEERETYARVTKLLEEADKAWPGLVEPPIRSCLTPEHLQVCVEALARHRLAGGDLEVMDAFFEFLVARAAKGAKGQYFTPRYVIELCVRMLEPTAEETVVDPACGSGGFLIHAMNHVRARERLSESALQRYCESKVWGFDIDGRSVRVARALMLLAGDGRANLMRLNSLLRPDMGNLFTTKEEEGANGLTIEDVCRGRMRRHKGFDVLLTNPPFAGEVREPHILNGYSLSNGRGRIERDVLFLERCVELLRPGGRMAIVLPHNKLAASSFSYIRRWLSRKVRLLGVVGLGRNTFLPHTHQKAGILLAQKRTQGEVVDEQESVFFAISENEGKNSKGQLILRAESTEAGSMWERVDHDLADVLQGFQEFRANSAQGD